MRLINVKTFKLEEFLDYQTPRYAILSHTWGEDREELTFRNVEEGEIDKPGVGSVKFRGCCRQAATDGLGYAWIDTCCIDKANLVELSEAINSMFRWYKRASVCYAYLSDIPGDDDPRRRSSKFWISRWFRRGWTLQELLAPKRLQFYNSEWRYLGTKGGMCAAIEEITGVPRPFLKGITDLHTASLAQRMSWAARRETKRKEDLAYCLLGIFGVTMPMIYGEGGEQAFFRLQEQIMKTKRDDSILAWGLGDDESPASDSCQVTPGRILAAAPSDFAQSGRIVSRDQSSTSLHSLDISGGSLRIYLSLLPTSIDKAMGLLRCGPEHSTQVVGIPLVKMTSGSSDEYARPRGSRAVLQPKTASDASPQPIHIKHDSQSTKPQDVNRLHWLYDDGFAEINLELVDVAPRSCWDKEVALITSTTKPDDDATHQILARFRHDEAESRDFVVVLEFKQHDTGIKPQCCVVTCCRRTPLEELAAKLPNLTQKASWGGSASNGPLNLRVALEPDAQRSMFIIRPEAMPQPPDVTIDATVELQKSDLILKFERILEEKKQNDVEEYELNQMAKGRRNRLKKIMREREEVEDEQRRLKERRRALLEEEINGAQEVHRLSERQAELKERQEHMSDQWLQAQKRWSNLLQIDCGKESYGLEGMDDQTWLRWAVENGCVEVVKLLLDKGVEMEVADKDGWTPLIAASSKGHVSVVRLLLTSGVNADSKDRECGRTPLSWAASNGREAVVQLLLDTGKVDANSKDKYGRTPLGWAAKMGHESIVQLLSQKCTSTVASALDDRMVRLWDAASGTHRQMLEGHTNYVSGVAFSPDGRTLASASDDHTVRLWDAVSGTHRQTLEGHTDSVSGVAFSPDGRTLASASDDCTVGLWDVASGTHRQTLEGHTDYVSGVAFSPDGRTLASASGDHTVGLWDVASGTHRQTLEGHTDYVLGVAFSPDGRTLASASSDHTVRLWDVASGTHRQTLEGHTDSVWWVAFSPDGRTLASASADHTVRLWDAVSGTHRQTLWGHTAAVLGVAFSPDGRTLASASNDHTVRLWDVASGTHRQTLEGHTDYVPGVAFSPDGRTLASASSDHTVGLWDAASGAMATSMP